MMGKKQTLANRMRDTATGGDEEATKEELSGAMATYRQGMDFNTSVTTAGDPPPNDPAQAAIDAVRASRDGMSPDLRSNIPPYEVAPEGLLSDEWAGEQDAPESMIGAAATDGQTGPIDVAKAIAPDSARPSTTRSPGTPGRVTAETPDLGQNRLMRTDFYSPNPTIQATDPTGRAMHMPSFGEVPLHVLGMRLQQQQAKKLALEQKRKQFRMDAELKETAPQFQQEFTAMSQKVLKAREDAAIEMFGGNKTKALDWMIDTREGQKFWRDEVARLNAIGTEVKDVAMRAFELVEGVRKGLVTADPEDLALSERIVKGYGSLGTDNQVDLDLLIKDGRKLAKSMSRQAFVNDFVLPDIKSKMQEIQTRGAARWENGMWVTDTQTKKTFEGMIEAYAKDMARMNIVDNVQEGKDYLAKLFGNSVVIETKVVQPSGSGSGSGSRKSGTEATYAYGPIEGKVGQYHQVRAAKVSSGAGGFMPPMPFVGEGGKPQTIHPVTVYENERGELKVVGKSGADPRARVRAEKGADGKSSRFFKKKADGTEEEIDEVTYFQNLPVVEIPYNGANEAAWENATGQSRADVMEALVDSERKRQGREGRLQERVAESMAKQGSKPATPKPGGESIEDILKMYGE